MKIKYLRLLDKYLGFLFCAALRIAKHFGKTINFFDIRKTDRILIIKFWGFGSVILAFDFFQSIRKKFPNAYICALTLKENSKIFKITGLFDEVVDIDIDNLFNFTLNIIKIIFLLRKKSFDVSFDLEFTSRFSAIVSCLVNAKKRIGFQYEGIWRGDCFTDLLHFQENKRLKDSYAKMIHFVNKDGDVLSAPLKLNIEKQQEKYVDNLLEKESLVNISPIVGMNINASELCLFRRWPKEYFVVLAEELIKAYSSDIIFIGSSGDFRYVDETIGLIADERRKKVHNFAGRISLIQLVYLISKLNLFITNDSGPLHLAVFLKIPTISFFGPETPLIYGPNEGLHTVFYKNLSCSPCMRIRNYKHARCNNNQSCLKQIQPSEVLNEIRRKGIL